MMADQQWTTDEPDVQWTPTASIKGNPGPPGPPGPPGEPGDTIDLLDLTLLFNNGII